MAFSTEATSSSSFSEVVNSNFKLNQKEMMTDAAMTTSRMLFLDGSLEKEAFVRFSLDDVGDIFASYIDQVL
jgi:hypothetical protein